ncbi:MAG: hypothetical protein KGY55_04990 [Candidatus Thermoplasmatota archaeon]|nr:hypothetical protein [Candidatus Thermoplasmatota archaeon]
MRAGYVATGMALMLLGALGLTAADPLSVGVLARYLPDGALLVLLAAGAVVLVAGLLPGRTPEEETSDFSSMKRCHGCGKMVPPDTIRCPNCNAKFTSLYDNL